MSAFQAITAPPMDIQQVLSDAAEAAAASTTDKDPTTRTTEIIEVSEMSEEEWLHRVEWDSSLRVAVVVVGDGEMELVHP